MTLLPFIPPIFTTWHNEIEAELIEARAELSAAQEQLQTATEASRIASIERHAITDRLAHFGRRTQLAGAIDLRRHAHFATLDIATGQLGRAREGVRSAVLRVEGLTEALEQLREIAPPAERVEEPAEAAA